MAKYTKENVKLSSILLDIENPRFASYFERIGKDKTAATQEDVARYLRDFESTRVLAEKIKTAKSLHPTELLACIKSGENYIVVEGNRRVCACKDLLVEIANEESQKDVLDNITELEVVVYESRAAAQSYISDKHIDGVKKWESIEKSCYYYRMFEDRKGLSQRMTSEQIVDAIANETATSKGEVKDCITKYAFYMSVYNTLAANYQRELLADVNSFLPLVDRFMSIIVGNDSEVGLNLPFVGLKYVAHSGQGILLNEILKLIGEAFLVRKVENACAPGEASRIKSIEVDTKRSQKKLIKDNERISGLFDLIKQYKTSTTVGAAILSINNNAEEVGANSDNEGSNATSSINADANNSIAENIYEPPTIYTPRSIIRNKLGFMKSEYDSFVLDDLNSDGDAKIRCIIVELSRLDVSIFQYAC